MRFKKIKKFIAIALAATTLASAAVPAFADEVIANSVICYGASLSTDEKSVVKNLLEIDDAREAAATVITVTNEEEHQYLDSYLPQEVIGTRALSSCIVTEGAEGSGILVKTKNISYCTEKMYQNALATAGMKDAIVSVAGPFELSGTAALVGALKAYSEMSGILIPAEAIETATNEIITTSAIAESVDDQDAATGLIAAVKEIVATKDLSSDEDIMDAIDEMAAKFDITLSDEDKQMILVYIKQFINMDIDIEQIKSQAPGIYQEIKNNGIDLSQYGISEEKFTGILGTLLNIWNSIVRFFKGFGK